MVINTKWLGKAVFKIYVFPFGKSLLDGAFTYACNVLSIGFLKVSTLLVATRKCIDRCLKRTFFVKVWGLFTAVIKVLYS